MPPRELPPFLEALGERLGRWDALSRMMRTRKGREAAHAFAMLDALDTFVRHPEETVAEINRLGSDIRGIFAAVLEERPPEDPPE